ncbi:MAG: RtcB family protein [Treponema sp.]|nr:RtcB family protein [Treponema sp.]MCL2251619.1 RtcB family protein [Treponema sp.]
MTDNVQTVIKPIYVKGKHNEALVFAKALESSCEDKIRIYLDHQSFAGTKVRIMPDVHLGKSTVIGWTATYDTLLIPSVIGFDIGCGVCACNLGRGKSAFDKLDKFIQKKIPSGQDVRSNLYEDLDEINIFVMQNNPMSHNGFSDTNKLKNEIRIEPLIRSLCEKQDKNPQRIFASLGTLGGGNHFIEVDIDEDHNRWLLIHSGSRILGAYTAEYHEILALRETNIESPIKFLSCGYADDYLRDINIVQHYAAVNRAIMAQIIAKGFFDVDIRESEYIDCVHNYIDTGASIIRKGAISAKKDERVVIPFSMSEGAVLGRGKGNADWNNSAPHGSGRKKTRTDARSLSLDEYRKEMRGVWSSVICKDTLEESPLAYKKAKDVLSFIGDTVEVERRLKPVYNFKAIRD